MFFHRVSVAEPIDQELFGLAGCSCRHGRPPVHVYWYQQAGCDPVPLCAMQLTLACSVPNPTEANAVHTKARCMTEPYAAGSRRIATDVRINKDSLLNL